MPRPPATPTGVVRSFLHHEPAADGAVYCRFDLEYGGTPPITSTLSAIAEAVSGAWGTHLASFLYVGDALFDVHCADLANPGTVDGQYTASVAGTRSGSQVPNSCTATLNFIPDEKYRGGKPKIFLPYLVEADRSTPQEWTAATMGNLATAWGAFISELAGTSYSGCTLGGPCMVSYLGPPTVTATTGSRRRVSTPRTTPLVIPLIAVEGSNAIGAQRRRTRAGL
jgi:hypothetical protein